MDFQLYKGRKGLFQKTLFTLTSSVGEPHHFYAASTPGENFDAAPAALALAPAPAPTLLYSRSKIFKEVKGNIRFNILFSSDSL
jgi:hypothetical protein